MTVLRLRETNARRRGYADGARVELLRQKRNKIKRYRRLLRAFALVILLLPRRMLCKNSIQPKSTATQHPTSGRSRRT